MDLYKIVEWELKIAKITNDTDDIAFMFAFVLRVPSVIQILSQMDGILEISLECRLIFYKKNSIDI